MPLSSPTPTQLIVGALHLVPYTQLDAQEFIPEEQPFTLQPLLYLSLRMLMLATQKLFALSARTKLEALFNMIIGKFNKQEIVEQLLPVRL